jgi:hypothetical protein
MRYESSILELDPATSADDIGISHRESESSSSKAGALDCNRYIPIFIQCSFFMELDCPMIGAK